MNRNWNTARTMKKLLMIAAGAVVLWLRAQDEAPGNTVSEVPLPDVPEELGSTGTAEYGSADAGEVELEAEKPFLEDTETTSTNDVVSLEESLEEKSKRRISTRVFRLAHASAEEVAEHFNATWSGEFGSTWKIAQIARAFPEANAVMVTAPTRILDACAEVIDSIDQEAKQVYIEARFVELGNTASHKLGIDWSMLDGMKASASIGGGMQNTHVGKGVIDYTREIYAKSETTSYKVGGGTGHNGNINYFNGTLNFSELSLTLQALQATEDARIFSNPKIIVSSGKKAMVDMTTKYPNVFISAKRTNSGQNINSLDLSMQLSAIPGEDKFMFAKEAFFSWGIQLEVTPRIGTNGLVNVTIIPTISDLDTNYGSGGFITAEQSGDTEATYASKYPIIKVQRLITEFNMASGTTAVIGGLSRTVESQRDTGIPGLRKIPWIGGLFGSKVRVKEQREILVFVTVGLVDPKAMEKDAGLPKNAVLGRQFITGQRLEPGDRPEERVEGLTSLDMRPMEEQIKKPHAEPEE